MHEATLSDVTASAIQAVLDQNGWSFTDHHNDIVCDHSEMGLDLDKFWNIRHRDNVWTLIVKDILNNIVMNISVGPRPKVALVYGLVVTEMEKRLPIQ